MELREDLFDFVSCEEKNVVIGQSKEEVWSRTKEVDLKEDRNHNEAFKILNLKCRLHIIFSYVETVFQILNFHILCHRGKLL